MTEKLLKDRIDDYVNTVFSILAFMSVYKYDSVNKLSRDHVRLFQGRRMKTSDDKEITPDIVIQIGNDAGIIGEVKLGLPKDIELWKQHFAQIKEYDNCLYNWETDSGSIPSFDLALLVHYSRSNAVRKYYENNKDDLGFAYNHNFFIIEYSRDDQSKHYLFLRTSYGIPPNHFGTAQRLEDGIPVPFAEVVGSFSKAKLYDVNPPRAYLLDLIYGLYISRLDSAELKILRKGGKIEIHTSANEICEFLREYYSFRTLDGAARFQPNIPKNEWIIEAIRAFIKLKLGKWIDEKQGTCIIYYKKGYDIDKFISLCVENDIDVADSRQISDMGQTELGF